MHILLMRHIGHRSHIWILENWHVRRIKCKENKDKNEQNDRSDRNTLNFHIQSIRTRKNFVPNILTCKNTDYKYEDIYHKHASSENGCIGIE